MTTFSSAIATYAVPLGPPIRRVGPVIAIDPDDPMWSKKKRRRGHAVRLTPVKLRG